MLRIKRTYDPPARGDGRRILVERLWPRGMKKEALAADAWMKEVAPSTELRKWFAHRVERWEEFVRRYRAELTANPSAWEPILDASRVGTVTLLYSAHDVLHNGAVVLHDYLAGRAARASHRKKCLRIRARGRRAQGNPRRQDGPVESLKRELVDPEALLMGRTTAAADAYPTLEALLAAVRGCRACEAHLPLGPRPVLRVGETARILVVGQAPGVRVHTSGVPWDDPSGDRLRAWMGVDQDVFYDESRIAIIPMGYCYPGRGNSGDLPPRRECAALWLGQLLAWLPRIEVTLLIGQYAQRHFLGTRRKRSLTATVGAWAEYAPRYIPLPHPSPRNQPWFKHHPWFEEQLVPVLRGRINSVAGC